MHSYLSLGSVLESEIRGREGNTVFLVILKDKVKKSVLAKLKISN